MNSALESRMRVMLVRFHSDYHHTLLARDGGINAFAFLHRRREASRPLFRHARLPCGFVVLARQRRCGALEHVEHGEGEDWREIDAAERWNDASEQVQVRVAQRRQRVHDLSRRVREPRQDQSTDDQSVIYVERREDPARDDAQHI